MKALILTVLVLLSTGCTTRKACEAALEASWQNKVVQMADAMCTITEYKARTVFDCITKSGADVTLLYGGVL